MPDKPMIPSEETTAGAVRQSTDSAEQCPRCGAPRGGRNPYLPSYGRFACGSYQRDDTATVECYRRQLTQAQERERAALAREARLRMVVDAARIAVQQARTECDFHYRQDGGYCAAYRDRALRCPDCPREHVAEIEEGLAALADAPPGVFLSDDDCCLLGRGLLDADEMRDHLTPEALERYRRLINRIIDVGVGEVDCPCDS